MIVLGLGDHIDCGSALLEDGRIIAAINDERLVREKMVFGVPRESIRNLSTSPACRRTRSMLSRSAREISI